MSERTKWLLKQPTWWIGEAITVMQGLVATGIVPTNSHAAQVMAGVCTILAQLVNQAAHFASAPRQSLDDMAPADRQKIFDAHPEVKARWEASHPTTTIATNKGE